MQRLFLCYQVIDLMYMRWFTMTPANGHVANIVALAGITLAGIIVTHRIDLISILVGYI